MSTKAERAIAARESLKGKPVTQAPLKTTQKRVKPEPAEEPIVAPEFELEPEEPAEPDE